ncbi:MAG: thiamine diphosphokinase [Anaerolineales bacterium]
MELSKRAVIVANGVPSPEADLRGLVRPGDLLLAADGGARLFRQAGLVPHHVVGDFDSLAPGEVATLEADGAQLHRHPRDKDETDLELAIRVAMEQGATEIQLVAALGGRWDQSLANLLLLGNPVFRDVQLSIVDGNQRMLLIRAGSERRIPGEKGDTVSLIPVGGDACGVKTMGLKWRLRDETLAFGATRGVSNVVVDETATVVVGAGMVVCVILSAQ